MLQSGKGVKWWKKRFLQATFVYKLVRKDHQSQNIANIKELFIEVILKIGFFPGMQIPNHNNNTEISDANYYEKQLPTAKESPEFANNPPPPPY